MKFILMALAGLMVTAMAVVADAAPQKGKSNAATDKRAACQAQAARRYSAIHFLARRNYVRNCMGETSPKKKR